MAKQIKTAKCPCGQIVMIPFINGEYCVCEAVCPKCDRHATGGNYITGEITSWMTSHAIETSNAEYRRQCFEADNNEFCGRGNW